MPLDEKTRARIAGAVAEVDLRQIAVLRKLTPGERAQMALSMIRLAERVGAYRLRLRQPDLSEAEALLIVRSKQDVSHRS